MDAYGAQHARGSARPIGPVFALVGLYLAVERGFTGRQVQKARMKLAAKAGKGFDWPRFEPPEPPWEITVAEVMGADEGPERDRMIRAWAESVWLGWARQHDLVRALCGKFDLDRLTD